MSPAFIGKPAVVLLTCLAWAGGGAWANESAARGEYILRAAGGCSCHTVSRADGFLAGGKALETPFGVFYSPNITPDAETGIGGWSDADFVTAMTEGVAPDGSHYFPAFPYPSFTAMTATDLADLKAYLNTVRPVRRANRPHDLSAPFGWRFLVAVWKSLYFEPGPFTPDPDRSASWNRGAYLANAVAHCGECHTPRDGLGGPDREKWYAGTGDGPEGRPVPNITPHGATGIADWTAGDIAGLIKTGYKPDFDNVQGVMEEAIEQGYKFLSDDDLAAIAAYVSSLPPIDNAVPTK
ncbi:MAG: cytochrome c [Alphaproteobacteria bacterium]